LLDRILAGKEKPGPEPASITQRALATVRPRDGFDDIADEVRRRGDGSGYIEAALSGEYDDVARAPKGKRNDQLNDSSLKLGHYVGGGVLDEKRVIDTMMDACARNGSLKEDGKAACLATIKSGLEKGKTEPKGIPERKSAAGDGPTADIIPFSGASNPQSAAPAPTAIRATPYAWTDPATIPQREWLYGRLLLRKFPAASASHP
jgi:hypothetical protein